MSLQISNFWSGKAAINLLQQDLQQMSALLEEAARHMDEISKGNLDIPLSPAFQDSAVGHSLLAMKQQLARISEDERLRHWLNSGLATFSDILRNKKSLSLDALSDDILSSLVKYVGANQGGIFIMNDTNPNKPTLDLLACYAYSRKKFLEKRVNVGEGLIGQCALEKDIILMTQVPTDYVTITSGLGEATPRNVLITPLMLNEAVFGVLELASFNEFKKHHLEFVQKLAENIAATIKNVHDIDRTQQLLNTTSQQSEELRAQEEEMRQNMEEMQATQEEMRRISEELNRAQEQMFEGLNTTTAIIELDHRGHILKANDNFLMLMGYQMDDIQGHHHSMFVPKDIVQTEAYSTFWRELASGKAMTGLFERVTSEGKTVWLNAIYNPIRSRNGEIKKIVKFATDATSEQELIAENIGIKEGINATMATIDFTPTGEVLRANDNFLKLMGYRLMDIRGKHHRMFVPAEVVAQPEYTSFWQRLAEGKPMQGVFCRKTADGNVVWLNAIYNPIRNRKGVVVKVVKFAFDVTSEQELIAEVNSIKTGINATTAMVEFTPEGKVLGANDNFLKLMGYKLHQIQGQPHRMFVSEAIAQSTEYSLFWSNLAAGAPHSGVIERQDAQGASVWLNAIYNPIRNRLGKVVRVVKYATIIKEPAMVKAIQPQDKGQAV